MRGYLIIISCLVAVCRAQMPRFNVTWADLKTIPNGGRLLDEGDCIVAIPHQYDDCVQSLEIGMKLRIHGEPTRWKGIGYYPYDPANDEPYLLVEDNTDGGEDMMAVVPSRTIRSNFVTIWKAERGGIIRPGDDLYPAYLITDSEANMAAGEVYEFNWFEDSSMCS